MERAAAYSSDSLSDFARAKLVTGILDDVDKLDAPEQRIRVRFRAMAEARRLAEMVFPRNNGNAQGQGVGVQGLHLHFALSQPPVESAPPLIDVTPEATVIDAPE